MIDQGHELPITKQCRILKLSRSGVYYKPAPAPEGDLALMRRMDELHLECPYFGGRGLSRLLARAGQSVPQKSLTSNEAHGYP